MTRTEPRRPGDEPFPASGWLRRFASGPDRTRWLAAAVLVPTVPLFLASVTALALFYAAPERFGTFLGRLPGTEIIRGALFFAPASLFAVGLLAALYALEARKPTVAEAPAPRVRSGRRWLPTAVGLVLLTASFSALVLTWVAPGRTTRILAGLGDAVLTLSRLQYTAVFMGVGALAFMAWAIRRPRDDPSPAGDGGVAAWGRAAARLILVPTVPLFFFSLAGLALSFVEPSRLAGWIDRIALDDWIRIGLIFAPTSLAAVLFLSLMVLRAQYRSAPRVEGDSGSSPRSKAAVWVLVGGLSLSAGMGMGVLGALALLLLR
ncbi:MAG: hypothetical protein WD906_08830 [Anaerolineales bacterium]